MLIEQSKLHPQSLEGHVAVVSGAGRGIGFETARALLWLGARVVIAEVDESLARQAEKELGKQFDPNKILALTTDIGDEAGVKQMARSIFAHFGQVDIVVNNATVTPMGAVWDVPIEQWDHSYRVNLRGPVLLAQAFVPGMLKRNYGVFACVSSVGQAYMGAYESFKAAQLHLGNTLDAELENTGVCAFTIGPGLVHTPGAEAGIRVLAPLYGKSVEEFYELSQAHILTVEEAGTGFAVSVALASQFRGQEISSRQALIAAGISSAPDKTKAGDPTTFEFDSAAALSLCRRVKDTLNEQSSGWSKRSVFERQWMLRDFKKNAGMPVDQWLKALTQLETVLESGDALTAQQMAIPIDNLAHYYKHLMQLAEGYEKDPVKLSEQKRIMQGWVDEVDDLTRSMHQ